ncbi:type VI secretion system protein TssA [Pseudomonas sp. CAU 1711]|uniref:type VI secretion system protein TssA n=1 Tax=Pseudomonas sp. CAU 1711 TaxID=3140356 RepID=UPI003260E2E0
MSSTGLLAAELLEPIPGPQPCGHDIRHAPGYDALREARREDDESLPTGVWQAPSKQADWLAVERLASELLRGQSKDLMVAAWLGEAWLHRHRYEGLSAALELLTELGRSFPDELHPQPRDGDLSWRASPIAWVVRRYAEVLQTRLPLFAGAPTEFARFSLADWQQLNRQQLDDSKAAKAQREAAQNGLRQLREELHKVPAERLRQDLAWLDKSRAAAECLAAWCDEQLAEEAPSFAPLLHSIDQSTTLLQEFLFMHPDAPPPAVVADAPQTEAPASPPAPDPTQGPASREEAYRQLALIAAYLARTEPHSPVPYLINRAVEWGQKPLRELLAELINADAEARRLWTLLGVLP